ncbi:hypothetical protein Leryth_002771 [Lithospermum erythrorhizon]|nr:hypothetical protein Leryth_002771 [Lithospermum erythrorhizon]
MATMAGLSLAAGGWVSNLIVYLIEEFNIKSIRAAKIYNFVNGCITLFPIVGAIIADSFLGCFSVVWISSLISLLGIVVLVLTAAIKTLRPLGCSTASSNMCQDPSDIQRAILYSGLALASLGIGGTRFTIGPMGANQFDEPKHQTIFFNWYIFTLYTCVVISSTAIVYVEDNVSWTLGFSLCVVANILGLAIFLAGNRFYRHLKPEGTPFMGLVRVSVAAVRKRKVSLLLKDHDEQEKYCHELNDKAKVPPTKFISFLNRAAIITEGDTKPDGSIAKPWKLCTVQQLEDLKSLVKLFPLWSTGLFLSIPLVIQASMAVLQALKTDRHLGHSHFQIPAGSIIIFILLSTSITITILDRLFYPYIKSPTTLQRVGIGHVLTIVSMAISALVESKRLKSSSKSEQISVFWLLPQLVVSGIGEAFHFPGHVAFYFQEFPVSLKSTSTAVYAMFIGIAYYLSNPTIDLVQKLTGWLPDDIDEGRLDNMFWVCCVVGVLNFVYFLVCGVLYKYKTIEAVEDGLC